MPRRIRVPLPNRGMLAHDKRTACYECCASAVHTVHAMQAFVEAVLEHRKRTCPAMNAVPSAVHAVQAFVEAVLEHRKRSLRHASHDDREPIPPGALGALWLLATSCAFRFGFGHAIVAISAQLECEMCRLANCHLPCADAVVPPHIRLSPAGWHILLVCKLLSPASHIRPADAVVPPRFRPRGRDGLPMRGPFFAKREPAAAWGGRCLSLQPCSDGGCLPLQPM